MTKPQTRAPWIEQKPPAPVTPCRILLVEDDPDDRLLSKKKLEASNLVSEVICFSDGEELINYMMQQGFQDHSVICLTPTIIVIDLNMPKMNGFEILGRLKSDPFLEDIPIVVVSGEVSYENIKKVSELKGDTFFKKPLNIGKIQSVFGKAWQWPTKDMWMH